MILLLNRVMALVVGVTTPGRITRWPDALPMHLCDWAIVCGDHRPGSGVGQLAYELAYSLGIERDDAGGA